MVFHVVWGISWRDGAVEAIGTLVASAAVAGVAAAVLSMMMIAWKEAIMVMFDWAAKRRRRWFDEGYDEASDEWAVWADELLRELKRKGVEVDIEPPPSRRNGKG